MLVIFCSFENIMFFGNCASKNSGWFVFYFNNKFTEESSSVINIHRNYLCGPWDCVPSPVRRGAKLDNKNLSVKCTKMFDIYRNYRWGTCEYQVGPPPITWSDPPPSTCKWVSLSEAPPHMHMTPTMCLCRPPPSNYKSK